MAGSLLAPVKIPVQVRQGQEDVVQVTITMGQSLFLSCFRTWCSGNSGGCSVLCSD